MKNSLPTRSSRAVLVTGTVALLLTASATSHLIAEDDFLHLESSVSTGGIRASLPSDNPYLAMASRSELPDEFQDPAFERYVDLRLVADAFAARDAAQVADVALQLAEGERVLLRTHKSGLTAKKLIAKAARLAGETRDEATLNRLATAAAAVQNEELVAELQAVQTLAAASRSTDPALSVSLQETDLDTLTDIKAWLNTVQDAALLGDKLALRALREVIGESERLSAEQRDAIAKQIDEAIETAGDPDLEDALLILLAGASRSQSDRQRVRDRITGGGWYIVWGKTVAAGDYATLAAAIATGNVGTYFGYLYEENVRKIKRQLPDVRDSVIRDAVLRALKGQGVVRVGRMGIKGGVATYRYWHTVSVRVPDGTERYKIHGPFGSWTWGYRPKYKTVTKTVPAEPNNHQPYFGFRVY